MTKPKTEIDIEKLLHWAYRDELSKRQTSAAEGIWERMRFTGQLGGIESDHRGSSAQRYAYIGLPDPDAEAIERAVSALEPKIIDWPASMDTLVADLSGLVTINDLQPQRVAKPKVTVSTWGSKHGGRVSMENRPRDVLLVNTLRSAELVTMHAIRASRPDWFDEEPQPHHVPAMKGPNAMVIGECRGRNLYTVGSHCPLRWEPSPVSLVMARAEYAAWWDGLNVLVETLDLEKFRPLPPSAPPTPWIEADEPESAIFHAPPTLFQGSFGLRPERQRAGRPFRPEKAGPVRELGRRESF